MTRSSGGISLTTAPIPREDLADIVGRTSRLIDDVVLPVEARYLGSAHDLDEDDRRSLQDSARDAGVFAPHIGRSFGGLGLGMSDRAPVFEAAGYSLFGPLALNCAAPDEGNAHLLERVGSRGQLDAYLRPLAAGKVRSCFAMTEPMPGAGADPSALSTMARRTSNGWAINGRKWFITGATGAACAIVMARTSGEPGDRDGATMFLVGVDEPGFRIERQIGTLDESSVGGHAELTFADVEVSDAAVLGEVDRGFHYAQVRLGPARITHCMRWLGVARRAADAALAHSSERAAFGRQLGELGMIQQMLADNEIDIEASRSLIATACAELDAGEQGGQITSITKSFVAEAVNRVVNRALQTCGALGISNDAPLSRMYREVRAFRIYDGPSETHRFSIARRALRERGRIRRTAHALRYDDTSAAHVGGAESLRRVDVAR